MRLKNWWDLERMPFHVEGAQRTRTEEFYEVTDTSFALPELNRALLKWEVVYDTVRPSQALGYLTPLEYLEQYWQNKRKEKVLPII